MPTTAALGCARHPTDARSSPVVVVSDFLPLVAHALLVLSGRARWVGAHTNRPVTSLVLLLTLAFFAWAGWLGLAD